MTQEKEPAYFADFRKDINKKFDKIDERFDKIDQTLEIHFEAIGEVKMQITELENSRSTKAIKNLEKRTKVLEDLLLAA